MPRVCTRSAPFTPAAVIAINTVPRTQIWHRPERELVGFRAARSGDSTAFIVIAIAAGQTLNMNEEFCNAAISTVKIYAFGPHRRRMSLTPDCPSLSERS
jgi:hypothetical protein